MLDGSRRRDASPIQPPPDDDNIRERRVRERSVADGVLGAGIRIALMRRSLIAGHFRLAAPPPARPQMKAVRLAFSIIVRAEDFNGGICFKRFGNRLRHSPHRRRYECGKALGSGVFDRRPRFDALIARRFGAEIPRPACGAGAAIVSVAALALIARTLIARTLVARTLVSRTLLARRRVAILSVTVLIGSLLIGPVRKAAILSRTAIRPLVTLLFRAAVSRVAVKAAIGTGLRVA